jgi:sec-independent protein translocase protein TatA
MVMGSFSLMHWVLVLFIILILFGAGKLPKVMGDFAKGIKAFKSGMKEEGDETTATLDAKPQVTTAPVGAHAATADVIRPADRA